MALSMLPPRPRPRERIISTSLVKPKVRARAMSRLYWPEPKSNSTRWPVCVHGGVVELDLEGQLVAVIGLQPRPLQRAALAFAHSTGFFTRRKRLGAFCSSMPALCSRNTKAAASRRGWALPRR
jgi:hypothetical protein